MSIQVRRTDGMMRQFCQICEDEYSHEFDPHGEWMHPRDLALVEQAEREHEPEASHARIPERTDIMTTLLWTALIITASVVVPFLDWHDYGQRARLALTPPRDDTP